MKMKWNNLIFQFKITLEEIQPIIWRRIQVPAKYSFWDLHIAIQDSMGWFDCHLHAFRHKRTHAKKIIEIGIPSDEYDDIKIFPSWDEYISDYFSEPGKSSSYLYDFGDSWYHEIVLEGILLKEKEIKYPRCIDGQRACPPEDCGGVPGYENLLMVIRDPNHAEHESMIEWLSEWYGKYDPESFDRVKIKFDNPKKRWKKAFLEHA
jgi:hypothetical protein